MFPGAEESFTRSLDAFLGVIGLLRDGVRSIFFDSTGKRCLACFSLSSICHTRFALLSDCIHHSPINVAFPRPLLPMASRRNLGRSHFCDSGFPNTSNLDVNGYHPTACKRQTACSTLVSRSIACAVRNNAASNLLHNTMNCAIVA